MSRWRRRRRPAADSEAQTGLPQYELTVKFQASDEVARSLEQVVRAVLCGGQPDMHDGSCLVPWSLDLDESEVADEAFYLSRIEVLSAAAAERTLARLRHLILSKTADGDHLPTP